MGFVEEIEKLPFHIIENAVFKNRSVCITFASGRKIMATCPDDNNQYDILKDVLLEKLGPVKVTILEEIPECPEGETLKGLQ